MVVNGATEHQSMVSSAGSYSATDLSRRTDRSGISIPDDGRAITIDTNRRRKKKENDTQSTLSHATNTSLLIEYFEHGKPPGSSGHRPSVRVKVTPSAAKRHNIKQDVQGGLQISEVGSRQDESRASRRPSHTHRISLAPYKHNVESEDRMTLGEAQRPRVRSRSQSGDHSTLSSFTSGPDSSLGQGPVNVTVIREAGSPGSMASSLRAMDEELMYGGARRRRARTKPRTTADDYYGEGDYNVPKGRSRSASRGSEISMEEAAILKARRQSRRRSRSLSRDRLGMSREDREQIERGVRAELEKLKTPKPRKGRSGSRAYEDGGLKPPRVRQRSRSPERELDEIDIQKMKNHRRKESGRSVRSVSGGSVTNNPALIELIQDTIKRLVLPEIEELKSHQKTHSKIPPILATGTVPEQFAKRPGKSNSMPMVGGPTVILSPDADKGYGQGVIIAGSGDTNREVLYPPPRSGTGQANANNVQQSLYSDQPQSPLHPDDGEGVSLVGTAPTRGVEGLLEMPDGPFRSDTPGTGVGTRASILTAKSGHTGLPYPKDTSGMPSSGTTPPPAPSSHLELSELNMHSVVGGDATALSDPHLADASKSTLSRTGPGVPSIASLNFHSEANYDDDDRVSIASSATREEPALQPAYSNLSLATMSVGGSTVLAKERKARRQADMSEINDDASSVKSNSVVNQFFAEQREREQERALMNPSMQEIEVRHVSAVPDDVVEPRHFDKVTDGRHVYALGANPSVRSTPVLARSVQPSLIDPSNVDGGSALSFTPHMGANANPMAGSPMPDLSHNIAEEDEDINTNPSIIQGPIIHQPASWDYNASRSIQDLDNTRSASHGAITPPLKDEGYMSAANAMGSPEPEGTRQMGGIDDMLDDGSELSGFRGHRRGQFGSGNSHGMPSPLYDSATGRGIDSIESKDIVALMEHLTVRDAQRNARDTEILVTLVRSAAEMRNSFEDMKRHLEDNQRNIIDGVDQNTERSVQKVLQGPRPLPPSAPRRPRYGSEEDADAEGSAKRRSVFKRALKGLSMRSSNDLQRIEEMLCHLLDDVEDLKGGQQFYQHSLMQSQSMGTFDNLKSMPESQASQDVPQTNNSLAGNSGYHSGEPSRQPSQKITFQDGPRQSNPISPINEDEVLVTPTQPTMRGASVPLDTPPDTKVTGGSTSYENTPTKSSDKEKPNKRESNSSSIFPKISRWSETTASSGLRNFLSKKKDHGESEASNSRSDFNFWEAEEKNHQAAANGSAYSPEGPRNELLTSPILPPSDTPINQSARISLDIQHPQPRQPHNYRLEMEAQAQQLAAQGVMNNNNSVSSLGTFPPLGPGGRMQNGKYMSPLAQDAYNQHLEQHQASLNAAALPLVPPKIREDDVETSDHSSKRRERRHHERDVNGDRIRKPKKERTEEERQKRKERKERKERERGETGSSSSRKKSRDMLSPELGEQDGHSLSGRTPSTASKLNGPRPLSSNSNKENPRRHRHMSSQSTTDTFGNAGGIESYGGYR